MTRRVRIEALASALAVLAALLLLASPLSSTLALSPRLLLLLPA